VSGSAQHGKTREVKKMKERGVIYFVRDEGNGRIKIGWTARLSEDRRRELQTGNSSRLAIIGVIHDMTKADEARLHLHFAGTQVVGGGNEWFEPSEELLALVATGVVNESVGRRDPVVHAAMAAQEMPLTSAATIARMSPTVASSRNARPVVAVFQIRKK